jgi:hypothetical protein
LNGIISGLDISYFNKLNLDYIYYNTYLNRIITGKLFNEDFLADKVDKKLQLDNSYVMFVEPINSLNVGMSSNIILPMAQKSINKLFAQKVITAKSTQFIDESSKAVYKENGFIIND